MKSGTVAIIGKPNAGKSTLINTLTGTKISIVSKHPATTRFRIIGIKTTPLYQIVFVDTPGLEKPRHHLGEIMQSNVVSAIEEADVLLVVVDGSFFNEQDEEILSKIKNIKKSVIIAVNKIDKINPRAQLLPLIERISREYGVDRIVPCSALTGENTQELEKLIVENLSEGEMIFPPEYTDSFPLVYKISEIIREKVFEHVYQEIPHSIAVEVEEMKPGEKNKEVMVIIANIIVEKENQKKIVIGKDGEKLKAIGSKARKEIEVIVGKKVYLQLRVKVIEKWRDRPDISSRFGYGSI